MAEKVPTELGGGNHGHTWLVTSKADYKMSCGEDITQDVVQTPKVEPNIHTNNSHATIEIKTSQKAIALNEYYTQ